MHVHNPIADIKARSRIQLRAQRDAIPAAAWEGWSNAIQRRVLQHAMVTASSTVFCYVSIGREAATRGLIDALQGAGCRIVLPNVLDRTRMEACEFFGWDTLLPGRLGIPTPGHSIPFAGHIDVALVPGLAFTQAGVRLGYGAGYYDRWFEKHPHTGRVGIAFEQQLLPELPSAAHDVPMHRIVTERRCIDAVESVGERGS